MQNNVVEFEQELASILSTQILELHLLATEKCNFRCVYCYEDFKLGKMKRPVINGIKNLIRQRTPELKQLKLSWFGGEPLNAFDVVYEISEFAKKEAEKQGCQTVFGITTNAYLLNFLKFSALIDVGVNAFQISLDGDAEHHDVTRLRADGKPTFATIWDNLLMMHDSSYNFDVVLRVHVTPYNVESIFSLVDKFKLHFKNDQRFKVFFKAIANLGGPHSGKFEVLKGESLHTILTRLKSHLDEDLSMHELNKNGLPYICYASAPNAWVIRSDGRLAKCTVAFNDERNSIGCLNEDGTFTLDQEKMRLWLRGLKNLDPVTLGCPAKKLPVLVRESRYCL